MAHMHGWRKDEESGQYLYDVSVFVNAPVEQCFEYWSNFESFPNLMTHVTKVKRTDTNAWHWEARVAGLHEEWDAVTSEFKPNEVISWQSTGGVENSGSVRFVPEGAGCRIMVHLQYDPPYGWVGDFVAERRVNDQFHADLEQDLVNFKTAVESGQAEHYRRAA